MPPKRTKSQTKQQPQKEAKTYDPNLPRLSYHILYVKDMMKSVKFFKDVLGWKSLPGAMDEWTELETFSPTKVALHLLHDSEGAIDLKKHPAGSSAIGLFVDNIQAFHENMVKHGVTVVSPPEKQPWGGTHAIYSTPENHSLSVVEAKGYSDDMRAHFSGGEQCEGAKTGDYGAKEGAHGGESKGDGHGEHGHGEHGKTEASAETKSE